VTNQPYTGCNIKSLLTRALRDCKPLPPRLPKLPLIHFGILLCAATRPGPIVFGTRVRSSSGEVDYDRVMIFVLFSSPKVN